MNGGSCIVEVKEEGLAVAVERMGLAAVQGENAVGGDEEQAAGEEESDFEEEIVKTDEDAEAIQPEKTRETELPHEKLLQSIDQTVADAPKDKPETDGEGGYRVSRAAKEPQIEAPKKASMAEAFQEGLKEEEPAVEKPAAAEPESAPVRQTQVTEVKAPANEYFKIESTPIHPKGFGVQLASFQEAANLVKRCAEIKSLINKDIMIQIGDKDGVKVYRIIAGPFETREKAEHFNKKLTDFSGSFIVTLE